MLIAVASLVMSRWSFVAGYRDHVNIWAMQRMLDLEPPLTRFYEENGRTWAGLDMARYRELIDRNRRELGMRRPPPPPSYRGFERNRSAGPNRPSRPPPPLLFDQDDRYLGLGPELPADWSGYHEIVHPLYSEGERIGALKAYTQPRDGDTPLPTSLAKQQRTVSYWVSGLSLLVAMIVGGVLAIVVIRPLRNMQAGVRELVIGRYDHRLTPSGSDELSELATDINQLAKKLGSDKSARQRWLADISHELRSPVGILAAEIEAVRDGVMALDESRLDSFEQEVARMRGMVDDLSELSRTDVGALSLAPEPHDMAELVRAIAAAKTARAGERGFRLTLDLPTALDMTIDVRRVDQLINNLIENSIAHTDSPGEISVALHAEPKAAVLLIDDSAPGVAEADLGQLFEPFFRGSGTKGRFVNGVITGTGLGLAICSRIVEAHRGQIAAEHSPLGGLRIRVELPRA
ncbi:MAG: ATP-binding protein [Pseudomonadota bacterium]